MKVAYCSLLLPEEKKLAERSKKRLSGISLHKLTRALIHGLDENLSEPVKVFNIINTLNYPDFPDLVFHTEVWHHAENCDDYHIGYINLFGIKYITQANNLYKKLKEWVKTSKDETHVVIVHHIYYPAMKAACRLKKAFPNNVKICLITGDMNGNFGLSAQYKPNLKEYLTHYLERGIDKMAKKFDSFVFATADMADGFGVAHKPFTVLECAYIQPDPLALYKGEVEVDTQHKTLFYAGALREEYGILHLLRAFSMIEGPEYRLWLAGDGNAKDEVIKYAEKDKRVEYLGFITPMEVDRRQKLSTAIVSPRTSELNFVKYSFPSKTMESLASGKPYIAHKLPCDPPEYGDYIQYSDNESDGALRDKIVSICEMPENERDAIGERAKNFILREKNPAVMCRRIVDMLNLEEKHK